MKDHYKVLGVLPTANFPKIKEAYKKLQEEYRPGRNLNSDIATGMMKMIDEAYATLSDPFKRKIYDRSRQVSDQDGATIQPVKQEATATIALPTSNRFDWVHFTCTFVRNVFFGMVLTFVVSIFMFSKRSIPGGLMQWLLIFAFPLSLAILSGLYSPNLIRESDGQKGDSLGFIIHFVFGLFIGVCFCFLFGFIPGMRWSSKDFPNGMRTLFAIGLPLLLGSVGGVHKDGLWEPLLKRWLRRTSLWKH